MVNTAIPRFTDSQIPTVIAESHELWYEKRGLQKRVYWDHYIAQLARPRGTWEPEAIAALDLSTDDVISRLSDPARSEIYQVKGLVMGYVQSGKTSHFSGLIAKAADAGYRLIIVLAGTMEILRKQTQRRLDKEIVGQEILGTDEYGNDADWSAFVKHGGRPSEWGYFDWKRLTDRDRDYSALHQHLHVLEFRARDPAKDFNHPDNLKGTPARLVVIKKIPNRIVKLCNDLKSVRALRSALEHVPTLIIDDESDQAGINTIDPDDKEEQRRRGRARSTTNEAIGSLLRALPRAQYVAYTATPFANVFVNPGEPESIFPKDFIVCLPRPNGYMGVSDFYDFDVDYEEGDVRGNKAAFVRLMSGVPGDANDLARAIDSFVLAGAIKLYRQNHDPKKASFRHHTMLVHHSSKKTVHEDDAREVWDIFKGGGRYQGDGIGLLRELLTDDFAPVSRAHAPGDPSPKDFKELRPFISECITRICDEKPILIVNGDNHDDTPDFEQKPVWAILVGGAKLSRGYTVEGLTTSYYRRPAGSVDTLMQMGRWFGFRPGYRDLVRLFIGKNERKGKVSVDLYEEFGAAGRDEEALRRELLRYSSGGLTPSQVPPLVHQHLPTLPPTAKNKMFNALIRSKDFSGEWTEKTVAPVDADDVESNLRHAEELLSAGRGLERKRCTLTRLDDVSSSFDAYACLADKASISTFLDQYRWIDGKRPVQLELEYIQRPSVSTGIQDWIILLPQVASERDVPLEELGLPKLSVIRRSRVGKSRFNVYSEPRHRDAAAILAGVAQAKEESSFLATFKDPKRAVLVLYFVEDKGSLGSGVTVGFGVQYPGALKKKAITWSVVDPSSRDAIVAKVKSGRR